MKNCIFIIFITSFVLLISSCSTVENKTVIGKNSITTDNKGKYIQELSPKRTDLNDNTSKDSKGSYNSKSMIYEITNTNHNKKRVMINYPQITNLVDNKKQGRINEILKLDALKVLNFYEKADNELSLNINYDIKWQSKNLLSVQYSGLGYIKGGAYPNNLFYTTNIDMNKGIKLRLSDIVNVNEIFVEKFRNGKYIASTTEMKSKLEVSFNYIVENFTSDNLIEYFNKADLLFDIKNSSYTFSYLTQNSLGISIAVPHAIGDHAEFEIKYSDILENLNFKNDVIKNLIDETKTE